MLHLFIICLDYVLRMLIDLIKKIGFALKKARSRWYPAELVTDTDYADDLGLLADTPALAKSLLATTWTWIKQERITSTLCVWLLKLINNFIYLGSNISSQEGIDCYWLIIIQMEAWTIWDLRTVAESTLMYGCLT